MKKYDPAICPMPGCDEALCLEWLTSQSIILQDLLDAPLGTHGGIRGSWGPMSAYALYWRISCVADHRILNAHDDLPAYHIGETDEDGPKYRYTDEDGWEFIPGIVGTYLADLSSRLETAVEVS